MLPERDKRLRFAGPVLNSSIRGWRGMVHFVNLGISIVVVGLGLFSLLFFLAKVEPPAKIRPTNMQRPITHVESNVMPTIGKDITHYASIVSKNIFSSNRKEWKDLPQVAQYRTERKLDQTLVQKSGLTLVGIAIAGEFKKALLQSKKETVFLKEGEVIQGYKVVSIAPKAVRMSHNGEEFVISMYKDLFGLSEQSASAGTEAEEGERAWANKLEPPDPYELEKMSSPHEEDMWRPSPTRP